MRSLGRVASWSAVAGVMALVAAAAVLGASDAPSAAFPSQGPADRTTAPVSVPNRGISEQIAARAGNGPSAAADLLSRAVLPPGTTTFAGTPTRYLANEALPVQPNADEFDADRLFTTTGSPSALVIYLRNHLPSGWSVGGPQLGPPPGGAMLLARVPGSGAHFQEGGINYEAVPSGTGTAVRVDAMVVWNPSRSPGEAVPPTGRVMVTGYATASLSGGTTGPITVSATGPAATRIRRAFDALAVAAPVTCMESENAYALRFAGRSGSPTVRVEEDTCPGPGKVYVTSGGTRMAPLLGDCSLLRAVAAVLPPREAAYSHRRAAACESSVPPLWP